MACAGPLLPFCPIYGLHHAYWWYAVRSSHPCDTIRSNPIQSHLDGLLPLTPHGYFFLFLTQPKSSITEFCIGEKPGILHSSRAAADCPIHHRVDKAVRPSGHKQSSPRSASQPGRLIKWLKFWPSTGRMTLVCVNIKFIIWSSTWSHCQPESAGDIGSGHIGRIGMVIRIGIGLCLMLMTAAYKTGSSGGQTSNICA